MYLSHFEEQSLKRFKVTWKYLTNFYEITRKIYNWNNEKDAKFKLIILTKILKNIRECALCCAT